MGDTEPQLAIFCNQEKTQVERLELQLSHKTLDLQFNVHVECSDT